MKTQHTPGPWRIGAGIRHQDTIGINREWSDGGETGEETIAEVLPSSPKTTAEADARLIASAPELLSAALKAYAKLADISHSWPGRHTAEGQGLLIELRDAISKATGRDADDVQSEASKAKGQQC